MLGYQCSQAQLQLQTQTQTQTQAQNQVASSARAQTNPNSYQLPTANPAPTCPSPSMAAKHEETRLSVKREPDETDDEDHCTSALSSLGNHMNNNNSSHQVKLASGQTDQTSNPAATAAGGGAQAQANSSNTGSHMLSHLSSGGGHQHQHQHQHQSASSPGYHSAAPSPTSSVASPVSSSSSSSPSSATSSGISTANSTSSSSSVSPSSSRSPISPNLLDYYPEINQDGLALSWSHDANNRATLAAALMSNKMIVSGDISLAEMSRYPVPIMAKPPLGVSDITLENWLQEIVHSQPQKGIKLTFTSTRTVEPAFRVLARHAEHLKGPVILNADILARPPSGQSSTNKSHRQQHVAAQNLQQQPVDAWTFLMLCRTRFPRSIISIGWCSPASQTNPGGCPSGLQESHVDSSSSLHSSADSMFELDIMDSQPMPALNQLAGASHLGHLQHLSHQHRLHQHLHPYPLMQQQHRHSHLMNQHQQRDQHQQVAQHFGPQHHAGLTHHILSSTGSLNSSSGNSSGSPSPTSPVSQLMSPPHQTVATNLSMGSKPPAADSTDQMFLAATIEAQKGQSPAATAAAAAAMAAAVVAATSFHQQQLPLNLNINEADQQRKPQATNCAGSLANFAHKIQSYQTISQHNLNQASSHESSGQQQAPGVSAAVASLSNKLFGAQSSQHIHKKAAIGARSAQPSPQSSSPKQLTTSSNLLLKTTGGGQAGNYTRDMIDKMASLVKEYNLTQPVTFPVEARILRNSIGELQRLLYQVGSNSTLTVVAQQHDLISVDDLLAIRKSFATNQILFDLPEDLASSLKHELDLI